MNVDYAIHDIKPTQREQAAADGHPVIENLSGEYDRNPILVACARGKWNGDPYVLDAHQLAQFTGHPVLVSLGSGKKAFDTSFLEQCAKTPELDGLERDTDPYGHMRVVEYSFKNSRGPVHFAVPSGGRVANLSKSQPTPRAYSFTTPLLVWECMKQSLWHLDHDSPGLHELRTLRIELSSTSGPPRRDICLYPREADLLPIDERDRVYQHREFRQNEEMARLGPFRIGIFWDEREWEEAAKDDSYLSMNLSDGTFRVVAPQAGSNCQSEIPSSPV